MKSQALLLSLCLLGSQAFATTGTLECSSNTGTQGTADVIFTMPITYSLNGSQLDVNSVQLKSGGATLTVASDASSGDRILVDAAMLTAWDIYSVDRNGRADQNYAIHDLDFSRPFQMEGSTFYAGADTYKHATGVTVCKIK